MPEKLVNRFIKQHNEVGVFSTPYKYNTEDIENAYLYSDLYLDFDSAGDFEKAREDSLRALSFLKVVYKMEAESLKLYFSGNKGVHIIVPAEIIGIEPNKELNGVFKSIAADIKLYTKHQTLDMRVYDSKRMFRIPCTLHEKTNLYKIPLTYSELQGLSHDDIRVLAQQKRNIQYKEPIYNSFANARFKDAIAKYDKQKNVQYNMKHKAVLKCTPPCIQRMLDNGSNEGARNNTLAALASFYKNKGVSYQDAIPELDEWNNTKNVPPIKTVELSRTVRSIYMGKASYGCSTLKDLSVCTENECPLKGKAGAKNVERSR